MASNKKNTEKTTEKDEARIPETEVQAAADLTAENEALKARLAELESHLNKPVETVENADSGPKMVRIRLTKDREHQDDVFVSVNLHTFLIQRGVVVEVPDYVAEVLQHQEEMLDTIVDFEKKNQK